LLAVSLDGSFYVPCYDHNGNVVAYIDEAGTPVARYAYDPFGNMIEQTGALADTFALRFSTKHFDAETGLYYYGRRFYRPGLGRWLNRDPIEEDGGLNLYAFCGNDGVNAVDPLGRKVWIVTGDMPVFSDKVADINQMVDVARKKVINKMNALFSSKSIGRIRFYIRTQTPSQSNYTDINERGVDIQTFF
jgi:RHS repeat-associated protein